MESETAFVWTDCVVELNSVSFVYHYFVVVVFPFDFKFVD